MVLDEAGSVYVAGSSDSDMLAFKYDSDGNEIWTNRHLAPNGPSSCAVGIALDQANNVIVTGYGGSNMSFVTVKYSQACDVR